MVEIIALILLCRKNGALAIKKGLKRDQWKMYTILAWIVSESIGIAVAMGMFDTKNIFEIFAVGIFCGFGGYLFIRSLLEKLPNIKVKDVNKISVDDLMPPKFNN